MTRRRTARGFTLLEMLMVLAIIVVLASITVVVALRMQERDQVPRAATVIQGALAQAKVRSGAERTNVGIRLILKLNKGEAPTLTDVSGPLGVPDGVIDRLDVGDLNGNGRPQEWADVITLANATDDDQNGWPDDLILCDAIEYIKDPGDFTDGTVKTAFRWSTGANPQAFRWVPNVYDDRDKLFLYRSNTDLDIQDMSNFVQPGDRIELLDLGQIYTIIRVERWDDPNDGPYGPLNRITLDRALEAAVGSFPYDQVEPEADPTLPGRRYRIIRQPQVIQGEKPLSLPTGAVLDIDPLRRFTQLSPTGDKFDILFSPRGAVVGTSSAQDMIFLWVHDARASIIDNQVLVTVYPKTGASLVFPVNIDAYLTGVGDFHAYARTGRAANTP